MAGRLRTQPGLLERWQRKFKTAVRSYLKALDDLNTVTDNAVAGDDEIASARDRERLLRGIVRGEAQCLIILCRPWQADDKVAIADLEIDYGMPGERSKPRPGVSPTISRWFEEYYDE